MECLFRSKSVVDFFLDFDFESVFACKGECECK